MKNEYKIFYTYKKNDLFIHIGAKTLQSALNRFLKNCIQKNKVTITKIILLDQCL